MAKMTRLWLAPGGPRVRGVMLRVDWDNDLRQAVHIKSLEPEDVEQGLVDAARLINKERLNDKI